MKKIFALVILIVFCAVWNTEARQLSKIAGVVNGQIITMLDLQKAALPELYRARLNPNDPKQNKAVDAVFRKTLDMMIMDILIRQEAKRLKITVSSSEIDAEMNKAMEKNHLSKKKFQEELAKQKISLQKFRETIELSLLRQKVIGMEVARRVVVTPEEIKAYYESHKNNIYDREGLHMGVLVYRPDVDAKAIAAKIKAGKLSFHEACSKYSIAPNRTNNGDTGPVQWDHLNAEWDKRLNAMKPGDVTDLFILNGKFKAQVLLFRPGSQKEKMLTLEEATPLIDGILRQPKAQERFKDYSEQLRKKAIVDIRL